MALIRARTRRRFTKKSAVDERGFETAEAAIVLPFLLVLLFGVIQGGIAYHANNLIHAAASNAATAASLYDATAGDGISAGKATANQAGSVLTDVHVTVDRTATEVVATVTAATPMLVPGVDGTVTQTITAPVERWVE